MNRPLAIFKRILSSAIGVLAVLLMAGTAAVTVAQSAAPKITSVTVSTVTNNSAAITFGTDVPTGAKILFGKTTAYGTSSPAIGYTTPAITNHVITLASLEGATTYHYQIEVNSAAGTTKSADRSFTTRSGTGTAGPLILNDIVADCIDIRCQVLFSPNRDASVRIVWDTTQHANFSDFPAANIVAETAITPPTRRALVIPNQTDGNGDGLPDVRLAPGTIYYYQLQAFEAGSPSPSLNTANLQFRTSLNSTDHTFSTGGCIVPTTPPTTIAIGQCGAGGYYCPPGGGPAVQDCTKSCGYVCPSNSTCRTSGVCEADPSLSGSPFQCNKTTGGTSACFDDNGQFKNPAPAGCYATWGKCNANTILKVQKDRGCNLWLTCATSVQTEPKIGIPAENLCLTLAACNSLNQQGQCNSYLPQGQCDNDPLRSCATDDDCSAGGSCNLPPTAQPTQSLKDLTFTSPEQVKQISSLSGNVIAGLDWNRLGGSTVIQGNLPWQLMRQVGGDSQITNGDFEFNPPQADPWTVVPLTAPSQLMKVEFEDQNNSINHVLHLTLITEVAKTNGTCSQNATLTCVNDAACGSGNVCRIGVCSNNAARACSVDSTCTAPGTCNRNAATPFAGAASKDFTAEPGEYYYAEARLRAVVGSPTIRVQFGHANYSVFTVPDGPDNGTERDPTSIDVAVKSAWQRVTIGPLTGMSGLTRLGIVCGDPTTCAGAEILIDDVQIKPVLQTNTNPSYTTPSCRLYPKADSPSCDYFDQNGVMYKGWKGYCLENDSVTGTCMSWWPVDILRGESSLFSANTKVGYSDRAPLYLCAEAIGHATGSATEPYTVLENYNYSGGVGAQLVSSCNPAGNACQNQSTIFNAPGTVAQCADAASGYCAVNATRNDQTILEDEITMVVWEQTAGLAQNPNPIQMPNVPEFRTSSASSPFKDYTEDQNRLRRLMYYDTSDPTANYWRFETRYPAGVGEGLNMNGVWVYLKFDKQTHALLQYGLQYQDATGNEIEGVTYNVKIYTKESCRTLVEVVKPDGVNQAYATRINSSAYSVPNLNYQQFSDLSPFGAALGPQNASSTPAGWPILPIERQDTINFSLPGQSRGGQPYACNGPCSAYVCSTRPSLNCLNADGSVNTTAVNQCGQIDITGDGVADNGVCTGTSISSGSAVGPQSFDPAHNSTLVDPVSDKAFFAQERIRRLFTQAYSVWSWSNGAYRQVTNTDGSVFIPWSSPQTICPIVDGAAKRPAYPDDYCAVPPGVIAGSAKFLTEGGTTATITGGSGSIGLKFNTTADPEQVPLQNFTIHWGDSANTYAYPYAPKNDPASPHIFSHVYNNTGPTCTGGNTTNCCVINNGRKTCNYTLRIQVKDNWGWCNNAVTGDKCPANISTWYNTGLTVRVQP